MYHFISSSSDSRLFSGMHGVTVKDFETQLSSLIKNGTSLCEKEIKLAASSGVYPNDDYFYLTFDDGFKQHFDNVFPVLKDYGVQASFFVPTMAIETGKSPVVEKQRLLQYNLFSSYKEFLIIFCKLARSVSKSKVINFLYPNIDNIQSCQTYLQEYEFYSNEERYFRMIRNEHLTMKEFSEIINIMFSRFYNSDKKFIDEYYLSSSDLKIMSNNGMIIGGHSHSHPFLNKLSVENIQKEIERGVAYLSKTINKKINSFAYPYGAFNDDVINCMRKNNMDYAFDTRTEGASSRYNLRRNDAADFFKG
jgi:peptidoglycan/xylan/chitin deacetylase (PgdA/CDA1 family)